MAEKLWVGFVFAFTRGSGNHGSDPRFQANFFLFFLILFLKLHVDHVISLSVFFIDTVHLSAIIFCLALITEIKY